MLCRNKILHLLFILIFINCSFAIDSEQITINGFASFAVEKQIDEIGLGDPNLSFDADLFDLLMNFRIGEHMRVSVDYSWEHGLESDRRFGNSSLEYMFIEHTWNDAFKFKIGKILTPFGSYNEIQRAKPAYVSVEIPYGINNPKLISPNSFIMFPHAGVGVGMLGETIYDYSKSLEYFFLIANGIQDSATNPFERDNNISKSLTSRIRFDLMDNLKMGKSFYIDKPTEDNVNLLFTDGYEFELGLDNIQISAEGMIGIQWLKDDTRNRQISGYIQPVYSFSNGVSPYLRWEYLKPTMSNLNDYSMVFLMGVHYEISSWYISKLEINYFHFGEDSGVPKLSGNGYTEFKGSLVLGF